MDAGAELGGEGTDRGELLRRQQVRAVGAHPAAFRRDRGQQGAGPSSRAANLRWSGPANSTNTGPVRRSRPASAAIAIAASGKKYMSSAVVTPDRRHSAMASVVPAATVSADSTAPSTGISRARNRSRSRSSASPRNRVIARWVWEFDQTGHDDRAAGVDRPAGGRGRLVRGADRRHAAAVDEDRGPLVHGAPGVHRDDGGVDDGEGVGGWDVMTVRSHFVLAHAIPSAESSMCRRSATCPAAASPAAITSAPSSGTGLMPAARLVANDTAIPRRRRGGRRWPRARWTSRPGHHR